jgi:hypothetical protein
VESIKPNTTSFWSLLKNPSGKKVYQPQNQPIFFNDKTFTKAAAIAKRFTLQFTSVGFHKSNPQTCRVVQNLHKKHKLDRSFSPFTMKFMQAAVQSSKNSSAMTMVFQCFI